MRTSLSLSALGVVFSLAAPASATCDAPVISRLLARAEHAERQHALGRAIALRSDLSACPQGAHWAPNQFALAQAYASLGDFARAADLAEDVAPHKAPPALAIAAMHAAIRYRIALRQPLRAQADVVWLLASTANTATTLERAFEVGQTLEAQRMWTEATAWYQHLATRFSARADWGVRARAFTGLGRSYTALGDLAAATRSWTSAVEQSRTAHALGALPSALVLSQRPAWPPPPPPPPSRSGSLAGGSYGIVSPFGGMPGVFSVETEDDAPAFDMEAPDLGRRALAEALFLHTRQVVAACDRVSLAPPPGQSMARYHTWHRNTLTPYIVFRTECLDATDAAVRRIIPLGDPLWQMAASALLAEENWRFRNMIVTLPPPPNQRHAWDF